MPRRTPDEGARPFEARVGIGIPRLGGIFRAGDPATIPLHKQHMAVNIRITPSGMITRPGLESVYNTGVEECIEGLTGEGEEISTVILYPGAPEGQSTLDIDPEAGGGTQDFPLNAQSFRVIFPRGGDVTYSEYANVLAGVAAITPETRSPVIEPRSPDGGTFTPYGTCYADPFVYNGRIHQFMVVPKVSSDGSTYSPALALVALDLPTRTKELASDCQRWAGYSNLPPLADTGACPGDFPVEPETLFPGAYPVGSSQVVFYVDDPFTSPETLAGVWDHITFPTRRDAPITDEAGVRELLYFLVRGSSETLKLIRWDGVVQDTVMTRTSCDTNPPPLIGKQTYGPWVLAFYSSGTGYAGYLDDSGAWVVLPKQLVHDYGPPTGEVDIVVDHWGAIKESTSGNGQVFVQGLMMVAYGMGMVEGRGMWVFEQNGEDAWDTIAATLMAPEISISGDEVPLPIIQDVYAPAVSYGQRFAAIRLFEDDVADEAVVTAPYQGGVVTYDDDSDATELVLEAVDYLSLPADSPWPYWLNVVAGSLYLGGKIEVGNVAKHRVFDITALSLNDELYEGDIQFEVDGTTERVSKGCLSSLPSLELSEGYASPGTEIGGSP